MVWPEQYWLQRNQQYITIVNPTSKTDDKKKQLVNHIDNTDRQIQSLRIELYDKFAELKKFEIALENHLKKEQNLLKAAETKSLDEFNTNQFTLNSSR